jgi:transposase InsO family protein
MPRWRQPYFWRRKPMSFAAGQAFTWATGHLLVVRSGRRGPGADRQRACLATNHTRLIGMRGCLNAHWFMSLDDARRKCEAWRRDYNEERPHSAIGNRVPIELANRSVALWVRWIELNHSLRQYESDKIRENTHESVGR